MGDLIDVKQTESKLIEWWVIMWPQALTSHMTLTLNFQILIQLYLRNGFSDWYEMKSK